MEPFDIQINISGNITTLYVFHDLRENTYDVFEGKQKLGVVYKDQTKGDCWCSDDPIPMEIVELIGKQIDLYEV